MFGIYESFLFSVLIEFYFLLLNFDYIKLVFYLE